MKWLKTFRQKGKIVKFSDIEKYHDAEETSEVLDIQKMTVSALIFHRSARPTESTVSKMGSLVLHVAIQSGCRIGIRKGNGLVYE